MIFYHGSKTIIQTPVVGGSHSYNDYGPSFYLTKDLESAKSWACKNDKKGLVNKYEIRNDAYSKLKILDLTDKTKYSILNWVALLVHFKELEPLFVEENSDALRWLEKYYINVTTYDVVRGFRADDSYWLFPLDFIRNNLSLEDLEKVYQLGELGIQYAFMSKRAINLLKFIEVIPCEETFVGRHKQIVKEANKQYDELSHKKRDLSKTYILDLMRKDYEKRWWF